MNLGAITWLAVASVALVAVLFGIFGDRDAGVRTYDVYKGGRLVARITNEPGTITSTATPPPPGSPPVKHPFLTATAYAPEEENALRILLDQAKSFDEYIALLTKNGFELKPRAL